MIITKTKAELEKDIKLYRLLFIWSFFISSSIITIGLIVNYIALILLGISFLIVSLGAKLEEQITIVRYELRGGF